MVHDLVARLAGFHLVLQVQQNGAVLLKLVAVEVPED
jgi:hypothetical protein